MPADITAERALAAFLSEHPWLDPYDAAAINQGCTWVAVRHAEHVTCYWRETVVSEWRRMVEISYRSEAEAQLIMIKVCDDTAEGAGLRDAFRQRSAGTPR